MTAIYTFDVFSSLDGFGSYSAGNWGGYWGKHGPELLERRLALYGEKQRMVFGANTYRQFVQLLAASTEESEARDPWVTNMRNLPATVVSGPSVPGFLPVHAVASLIRDLPIGIRRTRLQASDFRSGYAEAGRDPFPG
jgi:hypothetical protein